MIQKAKRYLEYRRNRKAAKRELARIAAAALPAVGEFAEKAAEATSFLIKLSDAAKELEGEKLVEMVLSEARRETL